MNKLFALIALSTFGACAAFAPSSVRADSTVAVAPTPSVDGLQSVDMSKSLGKGLRGGIIPQLVSLGQKLELSKSIPFLSRLEVEGGTRDRNGFGSITSLQPILQDDASQHHTFAQVSWHNAESGRTRATQKEQYSTLNLGLAYRFLSLNKALLYGANVFFDHATQFNHNRLGLGLDIRSRQLALALNHYIPLTDARTINGSYSEQTAGGWDMILRGQVPSLPSWTAVVKGFEYDHQESGHNLYGASTALEFSPVPALAMSVGARDDNQQSAPSLDAMLRLTLRFDEPQAGQWSRRTELASMTDNVYEKAQRDNLLRVKH